MNAGQEVPSITWESGCNVILVLKTHSLAHVGVFPAPNTSLIQVMEVLEIQLIIQFKCVLGQDNNIQGSSLPGLQKGPYLIVYCLFIHLGQGCYGFRAWIPGTPARHLKRDAGSVRQHVVQFYSVTEFDVLFDLLCFESLLPHGHPKN